MNDGVIWYVGDRVEIEVEGVYLRGHISDILENGQVEVITRKGFKKVDRIKLTRIGEEWE